MNPTAEGTYISDNLQNGEAVKAVAAKDSVVYIRLESNHTLRPYLFISKIMEIMERFS